MVDPTPVRRALELIVAGRGLDSDTARAVADCLMDGEATPAQIGGLLVGLRIRGETIEEIHGMALSMRHHARRVELPVDAVDTCGTGGDGCGTFNISTAAALVVAGAGVPVAKHGNRAASSRCGSADVFEALGVVIDLPPEGVRRCVVDAGIGFMFAPAYHPATRHVMGPRRELGVRTVFNVLGPICNPAGVRRQVVGAGTPETARMLAGALHRLGHEHALVVSGPGGLDEIGLAGPTRGWEVTPEGVSELTIDAAELGMAAAPTEALRGGTAGDNARIIAAVLAGERGPCRDVVLLNAAAALLVADRADTLARGVEMAAASIDSGEAARRLEQLVSVSRRASEE